MNSDQAMKSESWLNQIDTSVPKKNKNVPDWSTPLTGLSRLREQLYSSREYIEKLEKGMTDELYLGIQELSRSAEGENRWNPALRLSFAFHVTRLRLE